VRIGEASYLLPVAEDWIWRWGATGDTWQATVQFKNHRHFEAATGVQFQEETGPRKEFSSLSPHSNSIDREAPSGRLLRG
jgi:hypothetical protein